MTAITGTNEWSSSTVNCVRGCSHNCYYCFAKANAVRFKQRTAASWAEEKVDDKAVARSYGPRKGVVMFPSSHDITPRNLGPCIIVLRKLLKAGNQVLLVSKPHEDVIEEIISDCLHHHRQSQLKFRFTIGATKDDLLTFWEPGAPPFWERMEALRRAFEYGFETSISAEPMLEDPEHLIHFASPFVTDTIWLGKMNQIEARLKVNGAPEAVLREGRRIAKEMSEDYCRELYRRFGEHPKVRWKDSVRKVVGLEAYPNVG